MNCPTQTSLRYGRRPIKSKTNLGNFRHELGVNESGAIIKVSTGRRRGSSTPGGPDSKFVLNFTIVASFVASIIIWRESEIRPLSVTSRYIDCKWTIYDVANKCVGKKWIRVDDLGIDWGKS